mgnify:FL=1
MRAAIITSDGDTYEGTIELVSEVEPGQCVGCIFDTFKSTPLPCPKDEKKNLRCSAYSAGRTGIYVFVPQGKEIPR